MPEHFSFEGSGLSTPYSFIEKTKVLLKENNFFSQFIKGVSSDKKLNKTKFCTKV